MHAAFLCQISHVYSFTTAYYGKLKLLNSNQTPVFIYMQISHLFVFLMTHTAAVGDCVVSTGDRVKQRTLSQLETIFDCCCKIVSKFTYYCGDNVVYRQGSLTEGLSYSYMPFPTVISYPGIDKVHISIWCIYISSQIFM